MRTSVQKRHQKPAPPSEPPQQRGRSASRKKDLRGWSPSGKFVRQPCKDYLKGICTKSPCDDWHPPECHFYKSESGCKFGEKCSFAHRQVEGQPKQKSRKNGDKSAVATFEKCTTVGLRISGHAQESWYQFDEYDSQKPRSIMQTCEKTEVRRSEKFQGKVPHQRSPHAVKHEDRSQEEIERQERCARGDAWRLAKNILKLKETDKATFFSPANEWSLPAPSVTKPE